MDPVQVGLIVLSLLLLGFGIVGMVRGKITRNWPRHALVSPSLVLLGLGLLFVNSAPPLRAQGIVGGEFDPPPAARATLAELETIVRPEVRRAEDLLPEQQHVYEQWERQLLEAHDRAEGLFLSARAVMTSLNEGSIDRFTAWSRLGVLAQDLRQVDLRLHDLTPPSKLNLRDQQTLHMALDEIHHSLGRKAEGLRALRAFTERPDSDILQAARDEMNRGHEAMVNGLTKIAQVKARLDL